MAAAAELEYFRPPESEIYGRSLSTILRLGALMVERPLLDAIGSPEAAQAKVEFFTSVEEGFGTDMELGGGLEVRDFDIRPVIDGRVMAKDLKTAVSSMTEAGLACAIKTENKDWRFSPQLTRSKWDHKNALMVDKMARGETDYNTRIVMSPFPEEAAAQSGSEYWRNIGYVPHLKRGFVQMYHVTKDGELISGSLSFDGSNKQRLREVFGELGVSVPEGEITDNWLKYAITDTLSPEQARQLATGIADMVADPKYKKNTNTIDVTEKYRPIMERTFNEAYIHVCESLARGRQTDGVRKLIFSLTRNAHDFNKHYESALYRMKNNGEWFTEDDSVVLHELLVYSTIEMMRALHLGQAQFHTSNTHTICSTPNHLQSADPVLFQAMLSNFGADGAKANRTYSACGLSITLGGDNTENSPQSTFGGRAKAKAADNGDCEFMSKECPLCKAKNVKTLVRKIPGGKKRISGSCGCSTTAK